MFNRHILCTSTIVHCMYHCGVLCTGVELNNSQREYIFITSAYHIILLAKFMGELGITDFCCDGIIMQQDVLFCLLIGFWHLCHNSHVKPFYSGAGFFQ